MHSLTDGSLFMCPTPPSGGVFYCNQMPHWYIMLRNDENAVSRRYFWGVLMVDRDDLFKALVAALVELWRVIMATVELLKLFGGA